MAFGYSFLLAQAVKCLLNFKDTHNLKPFFNVVYVEQRDMTELRLLVEKLDEFIRKYYRNR